MIVTSLIVDDELDVSAVIRRKQVHWLTQWMGKRTGFGEERDLGSWMFKRFVLSSLSGQFKIDLCPFWLDYNLYCTFSV